MIGEDLFAAYASRIAALPNTTPLPRGDLLTPDFLLHRDSTVELYYAPFDYVNEKARVALIGIAPGWYQAELSFRTARDALRQGLPYEAASALARRTASFSGPIRRTLVSMLDGVGIHEALGIASCAALYGEHHDLLHTTATVRYPVFVQGKNYSGYSPDLFKTPILRRFVTEALPAELARTPGALVIPLGKSVSDALRSLAAEGLLDAERLLPGLPHPSGANAHRHVQYERARPEVAARVRAWFGD